MTPAVNCIIIFHAFFRTKVFFLTRKICQNVTFVRKSQAKNVDEIDTRCKFHLHFTRTFCSNMFCSNRFQSQNVTREKLHEALSCKKLSHKMLVKLTTGVNFINVFTYKFFVQTAFQQLFLVTFWLGKKFVRKNAHV